jgi:hypothetical protein
MSTHHPLTPDHARALAARATFALCLGYASLGYSTGAERLRIIARYLFECNDPGAPEALFWVALEATNHLLTLKGQHGMVAVGRTVMRMMRPHGELDALEEEVGLDAGIDRAIGEVAREQRRNAAITAAFRRADS